jgi:uroporphyrinogen decarboxylase
MTSRERVRKALNHEQPDRTPIDLGATRVTGISVFAYARLREYLGISGPPPKVFDAFQMLAEMEEPVRQALHIDCIGVPMKRLVFNLRIDEWKPWRMWDGTEVQVPIEFEPVVQDNGDILIRNGGDATGPFVAHMPARGFYFDGIGHQTLSRELALVDPEDYRKALGRFSDEDLDFVRDLAREYHDTTDYSVVGEFWGGGLWVPLNMPDALVAFVSEPAWCREILQASADAAIENAKLYYQAVGDTCDVWVVSGTDFGTQKQEFLRPSVFADLFAPEYRRIMDWIHENTPAKTFLHSCGNNRGLLPIFIDMGVDIFNPVQCSAARMDPQELKDEFGEKIVFWGGGINTQETLPRGSADECRAEATERCHIFGKGGGFVFNAIHNIQANTPPGNIVAMMEGAASGTI